jgi:hypothetical protein
MPEIMEFVVAANNSGLLELAAIARLRPGEELHADGDSAVFSGGVWINQQLPHGAQADSDEWVDHWRSLGEPGDGDQRSGITIARNPDGRLEAAVLNTHTVWHAWQTRPDGNWSPWDSLGSPAPEARISSPALATSKDGRLQLFTTALIHSDAAVWYRRQAEPGKDPWEKWQSLGYPEGEGGSAQAPVLAQNLGGRLELFIAPSGKVWHCWQTAANSSEWSQWESLGTPGPHPPGSVKLVAARGKDGRLQVLAPVGDAIRFRRQSEPGRGPWEPWMYMPGIAPTSPGIAPPSVVHGLTVAAQADGRLVLFVLRRTLDRSPRDTLEMLRQTVHGEWSADSSPQVHPSHVTRDDPTLVGDGDGRLWLFFRILGQPHMSWLNQRLPNGSEWGETVRKFDPPKSS